MSTAGGVDQMASRQRDERCESRSFCADRLLGYLYNDLLPAFKLLLDWKTCAMPSIAMAPAMARVARIARNNFTLANKDIWDRIASGFPKVTAL